MKQLQLAFLGNGAMSKAVQQQAQARNHLISSIAGRGDAWQFQQADIVIECTTPDSVMANIEALCKLGKDLVIVTTGWYEQIEAVRQMQQQANNRILWSSNFSIGVHLYFRMVQAAAKLINQVEEYDVWGHEIHHRNKVDSPSGTAKTLEQILLQAIDRKTAVVEDALQRKIEAHELHFSSTRGGLVNFGHTIGFDSAADCIEIKHTARNRDGYALGTVKAAEWLANQASGFYSMDDFLRMSLG